MEPAIEKYTTDWTADSVRLIHTPSAAALASFFYVQEAGYFRTLPGYFTERSRLPSFLMLYTLSGRGKLRYMGATHALGAGDAMFINCMEHHVYTAQPPDNWEFLWVHFYGATSEGYYKQFAKQSPPVIAVGDTVISQALRDILELQRAEHPQAEVQCSRLLMELLTAFLTGAAANLPIPAFVQGAADLIRRAFDTPLSLDELSEAVRVSKYHLCREFKKHMGCSPGEYLNRQRIGRAKELLRSTDQSIESIAAAVGAGTENRLLFLFKGQTGLTPSAYRKMWKSRQFPAPSDSMDTGYNV